MPIGEPIVHSSQRDRQLAPLLHCGFLLVGIVHTLLGPILPMLAARWRLDDAEAGSLFIAQFTGAMFGVALSGAMIERLGSLRLMAFSYAAMARPSLVWASTPGGLVSCRFSATVLRLV
jgi:MFS transporter, FHS family, glucose/mannose:H+ symporter